jgi:tRNA U34 2-thiouridine synthase MnmA/TrmU
MKKNLKIPNLKPRALVLFSGGLDSRITVKILQEQGIETELVYFKLPFGCGCCNNLDCSFNFSQVNDVKMHVINCEKGNLFVKYLDIVRNPKYGYGRGLNPCISCRIFMLKEAKKLLKKFKCDFIATGEVLGQRPMSQYKKALFNIEKEANLSGKILRPLSAKLLPETEAEKNKLITRTSLLGINGRKRSVQIALAKKYNIKYPNPAGGCLLCDREYSARLNDLLKHKNPSFEEIKTLALFRHFRSKGKIILGRNKDENRIILDLNKKLKYFIIIPNNPGPTCIYENKSDKELAEELILAYSENNLELRKKYDNLRIRVDFSNFS